MAGDGLLKHKINNKHMRRILFLDDCNMFEARNPIADLVEIQDETSTSTLRVLEDSQRGVYRRGGKWREIMEDGKIKHAVVSSGRESDYSEGDYDEKYRVVSGNY